MSVYYHLVDDLRKRMQGLGKKDKDRFDGQGHMYYDLRLTEEILLGTDFTEASYIVSCIADFLEQHQIKDENRFRFAADLDKAIEILRDAKSPDRCFDKMIFLGRGHDDPRHNISGQEILLLHARLDEGLSDLGGMQQPCHAESEKAYELSCQQDRECERNLRAIVSDISMALLGMVPTAYATPKDIARTSEPVND